jgi:hypothetical protein
MPLEFVGDAPVYVPETDSVKFMAVHSGGTVSCFARRSALIALGCQAKVNPLMMLQTFEAHRFKLEKTAAKKFLAGSHTEVVLSASDLLGAA